MAQSVYRYLWRTVLVKNNDIESASRVLDRVLRNDKVFDDYRRNMYYEKPTQTRRRLSYERCKRIYNADMQRKIQFLMRKNRPDPCPR